MITEPITIVTSENVRIETTRRVPDLSHYDTKYDAPEYQPSSFAFHSHQLHVSQVGDKAERMHIHSGSPQHHVDGLRLYLEHHPRLDSSLPIRVELAPEVYQRLPQIRALIEALDLESKYARANVTRRDRRRARAAMRKVKRFEASCKWTREYLRLYRTTRASINVIGLACKERSRLPKWLQEVKQEQVMAELAARSGTTCDRCSYTGKPIEEERAA